MTDEEREARKRHPAGKGLRQSKMGEDENYSLTTEQFEAYAFHSLMDVMIKIDSAEKQSVYISLVQQGIKMMFTSNYGKLD